MTSTTAVLVTVILGAIGCGAIFGGRPPRPYRRRSCQGGAWRRAFPSASKREIRAFLSLFVEGFAFRDREKLKFAPDDEIAGIYRTLYPSASWPDAMEFETLSKLIEKRYGTALSNLWKDHLTLGELFSCVRGNG